MHTPSQGSHRKAALSCNVLVNLSSVTLLIRSKSRNFLPPANEVCEGYVLTPVCHSVHSGHVWQRGVCGRGPCTAGDVHGRGVCVAVGMHDRGHVWQVGHAWQGGVCGRGHVWWWGHAWQGVCMVGGICGRGMHGRGVCVGGGTCMAGACRGHAWQGVCMPGGVHARGTGMPCTLPPNTMRYGQSMHRRYASYWNAFLLNLYCLFILPLQGVFQCTTVLVTFSLHNEEL